MATFLVTWNPEKYPFNELSDHISRLARGERVNDEWSTGTRLTMPVGSRLFLLRQGEQGYRGIVGSGYSVDEPRVGPHYDPVLRAAGKYYNFVPLVWDVLLKPGEDKILERAELDVPPLDAVYWDTPASGIEIKDPRATELERLWQDHLRQIGRTEARTQAQEELGGLDPLRLIKARRGQKEFRDALLERYSRKCMISGCDLVELLEAAHIRPYSAGVDNRAENGLLLRTDLHTLFDLNLIGVDPATLTVQVSPNARSNGYERYHGMQLRCGVGTPSVERLLERWSAFSRGVDNIPG